MQSMFIEVGPAPRLSLGRVAGDLIVQQGEPLRVLIESESENLAGQLQSEQGSTLALGDYDDDLRLSLPADATLLVAEVSGDVIVRAGPESTLVIGSIDGDLELRGAASVHVGMVDNDVLLQGITREAEIGQIGGDLTVQGIAGRLEVGVVADDAILKGVRGDLEIGSIGSDLTLEVAFAAGSRGRLNVGGDALIDLPADTSLTLRALVGGDISGSGLLFNGGRLLQLVYGDGAAQLDINVGGDLCLQGKARPRTGGAGGRPYRPWEEFERDMQEFAAAMAGLGPELAREMRQMAQDLLGDPAFASFGKGQGWQWSEEVARRLDEQARRAQRSAEAWRQRFARFWDRSSVMPRVRIRLHEHEWRMDPERLRRIVEEAQRAATEGITGALEAVEHALQNLGVAVPPAESPPGTSSASPSVAPHRPPTAQSAAPTTQGEGHVEGAPAEQERVQVHPPEPAEGRDQEREAILRMIAEGRLSTEEGDMLLEALDD